MKKTLLLIILFSTIVLSSYAQDAAPKPVHRHTYLKINPTTLINELDISLEQVITDKISIEIGVSGIYTDYPDYVLAKKIDIGQKKPDLSTSQFVDGRGLGFRAGLRYYLITREIGPSSAAGTYFEPIVFYKKVFYPNEDVFLNGNNYSNSGYKDVFGLQLLVGRQYRRDKVVLDPYFGIGIRSKIYHSDSYKDGGDNTIQRNQSKLVSVLPSIHLGIKLGLSLHHKYRN
ncbi:hypothetical protein [Chitinophaga solisilvae]|uniref:Uncharacterized protein n=1 Tax=Chitinophaga solisilvae TaxID=1233460 RepID=A0A433WDL9_9BACT|nr:hypothetical protein [Chitinophaga solisilvae]NSL89185.1 hypothetical protein [Chitinophaga solisilvae]